MPVRRQNHLNEVKPVSGIAFGPGLCSVVFTSLMIMAILSPGARAEMPNLAFATMGGTQLWADEKLQNGWRIQRNEWTGHFRLLDVNNVRRAWGSYADCLRALKQSKAGHSQGRRLVLLVHGIGRGPATFGELPLKLRKAGYAAYAISYPSTRGSIQHHATQLERLLGRMQGYDEVSFVTHSMGGLVVRQLLAGNGAWKRQLKPRRLVMIAPPSQGSIIARTLQPLLAYKLFYGVAGQQLTPKAVRTLAVPNIPFAIIAGGRRNSSGYNPLVPGDDDGTVSVAETRLDGAFDFLVLPGLHGFIARSTMIEQPVVKFLDTGRPNRARRHPDG